MVICFLCLWFSVAFSLWLMGDYLQKGRSINRNLKYFFLGELLYLHGTFLFVFAAFFHKGIRKSFILEALFHSCQPPLWMVCKNHSDRQDHSFLVRVQDCWTICKSPSESPFSCTFKSPLLPYPHRGLKRSVTQLLIILFPSSLLLAKTLYRKMFQACLGIYCLVCMSKPFHWLNWEDNHLVWNWKPARWEHNSLISDVICTELQTKYLTPL